MKYYTLDRILAKHATYNLIIGERSNGKTYAILYHGLKEYFQHGGQIAIVRRWKEDITGRRASAVFSALIESGAISKLSNGEFSGVYYWAGKFFACNYDDEGKAIYNDTNCIGYCFALSDTEHNKSISYPRVTTIFFDEFLTKHLYLNDEFVLFLNTVSTIVRQRDNVTIFMAGNTVNKYCPYFAEMGLKHIDRMEQGAIDVYRYGDSKLIVAVEYCATLNKQKKSNFYFAFDNPKLQMITGGKWEMDIFPHCPCKYKPADILLCFFIEFNGAVYQCEVVNKDASIFIFAHVKTTPLKDNSLVYSLDDNASMWYNKNIFKPAFRVGEKIRWLIDRNKIFYQDNEVGNAINNYFRICRGL